MATAEDIARIKLLREKRDFFRTEALMAVSPDTKFNLKKGLEDLNQQINKLETLHPELKNTGAGQGMGLRRKTSLSKVLECFNGLDVRPSSELGLIHRMNCDRRTSLKSFNSYFENLVIDRLHDYQVYLITACERQMPTQFAKRLVLEIAQDEDIVVDYSPDHAEKQEPRIERLPIKAGSLRQSQRAFEQYIARRFDLKGEQDVASFLAGQEANYEFKIVVLTFEIEEGEWEDFIPEYYRWIIDKFQELAANGPKFLLTFIHHAEGLNEPNYDCSLHEEMVTALDALEAEVDIVKHLRQLAAVPIKDFETWLKQSGVSERPDRTELARLLTEGLSDPEKAHFEQTKQVNMEHIDREQRNIYKNLTSRF